MSAKCIFIAINSVFDRRADIMVIFVELFVSRQDHHIELFVSRQDHHIELFVSRQDHHIA